MRRIAIVGAAGETHVGAQLLAAAGQLELQAELLDSAQAFGGPAWLRRINWKLRGSRPPLLTQFSTSILEKCRILRPHCLLATGFAPIDVATLRRLQQDGVRLVNYLTDDPWNPALRAPWFLRSLPFYDHVFSTRRANLADLTRLGCGDARYLPFGYSPALHFREPPGRGEAGSFSENVVFVGGADWDRVPFIEALIRKGVEVGLYGGYWERFRATRQHSRGIADLRTMRKALSAARLALCLVRRANRDGSVMRTFEVPAIGTCMLTEDTTEHRELFGPEGDAVAYFKDADDMLEKVCWLLGDDTERERLARSANQVICQGQHTYRDRLQQMLALA